MKAAVRYYSKSGSTKKLAGAIAEGIGTIAEPVTVPLSEPVDLLFLGGAVYGGSKIDEHLKAFVRGLSSRQVKKIAVFSCSNWKMAIRAQIEEALTDSEIAVVDDTLACRGRFYAINPGRPNAAECAQAAAFAKNLMERKTS